jgi:uncharacterized membrane protein YphA (DoxX/SURF4 family)
MTENRLSSYGVFLLRIALGAMFLAHSTVYMLMTLTLAGTAEFFVPDCRRRSLMRRSWPRLWVEYSSFWVSRRAGWRWRFRRSW